MKILTFLFLLLINELCYSQNCPPGGKTKTGGSPDSEMEAFNKRKNKSAREPDKNPKPISFSALKSGNGRKNDRNYWLEGAYVELSGAYLIDYKQQGGESCNCYEADNNKSKGDIHINIGTKYDIQNENNNYYVIIEITPSYKKLHPDFLEELQELKGKKIVVRGYLFYDYEHERNSINYCESCSDKGVWRKTCWEVHPVTYIAAAE